MKHARIVLLPFAILETTELKIQLQNIYLYFHRRHHRLRQIRTDERKFTFAALWLYMFFLFLIFLSAVVLCRLLSWLCRLFVTVGR